MLDNAPKYITDRYYSINKYVWQDLFTDEKKNQYFNLRKTKSEKLKLMKSLRKISQEASLALFVFYLNQFFKSGTNAAINAVDIFSELSVPGFKLGKKVFANRNENVLEGETLSKDLIDSIKDPILKNLIVNSTYPSEILNKYKYLFDEAIVESYE